MDIIIVSFHYIRYEDFKYLIYGNLNLFLFSVTGSGTSSHQTASWPRETARQDIRLRELLR